MASSLLYPGELVIDDNSPSEHHAAPESFGTGLMLPPPHERSYAGVAEPFPTELLIPQSEWQARIQEMEAQKSRLSDIVNLAGLPPKNQERTNYCWMNSIIDAIESIRCVQNEPMVILSPASAAGPMTGYRNVGGWGRQALEYVIAHGACPVDVWPANAIDSRYATPGNMALAAKYKADEWWVLDNSLEQIASCLLRRIPVSAGLSWWGHQVTYFDLVWLNGAPGIRFRNSWGPDWPSSGAGGWSILQGRRMYPDDSTAPRTAIAA